MSFGDESCLPRSVYSRNRLYDETKKMGRYQHRHDDLNVKKCSTGPKTFDVCQTKMETEDHSQPRKQETILFK